MNRREFLKESAVGVASAGFSKPRTARSAEFILENESLAWRLAPSASGVVATSFENRLSGRQNRLRTDEEFALTFARGPRIEIPWWNFRLSDSGGEHFEQIASSAGAWKPVNNLAGGQKGRVYAGYGWYRHEFALPESAGDQNLTFVLGGYDEQDWNEHRVYLNGTQIGHRSVSGRWRVPGRYTVTPAEPAYAALQFGPHSRNLLAVRTHGYDFSAGGLSGDALEQYVFRPFLFDQYISIGEPDRRVSRFKLVKTLDQTPERLSLLLEAIDWPAQVTSHYELDGFVRRKWLDIQNRSSEPALLLDVQLDLFQMNGQAEGGGHGKPVFLDNEAFGAIEHPAGINQASDGHVRLWHCPGRAIAPGATLRTKSTVVAAAPTAAGLDQFHKYLKSRSPRRSKGRVSIFTCFGTNNQWGACPTLSDSQVLDDQRVVEGWQKHGVKLDFFTLDTGWPAPDGDLTEFVNTCYPDGPARMIEGVHRLGMKFGLWFSEGWGGWANGLYPPIQAAAIPEPGVSPDHADSVPLGVYRNGYPVGGGSGRSMCMAAQPFYEVFRNAILHHVRQNQARLLKFDSGTYYCNSAKHGHLPGKYSTEAISDHMIEIVETARGLAPEVFVMWYWGEGSPFWALHGDVISESGLFMEGSGTSQFPTLYYRDSVTLSLDQNTQFARLIPPMNKDSLGIWLSQIRWGNFMGKERWREALVMDLGRGNLVFPQLWGDPNLLGESDIEFLARMIAFARTNEQLLERPRRLLGDTWKNEPYAYAFCQGARGLLFCNNAHFTARSLDLRLDASVGISANTGTPLYLTTHFPERSQIVSDAGLFLAGQTAPIWLRPFETMLLEISPGKPELPPRPAEAQLAQYGAKLDLTSCDPAPWMNLKFADGERFEHDGMQRTQQCFSARLPKLSGTRSLLAVTVKLTKQGTDYRYAPFVAQIIQLRGRLAGRNIQMIPVPDARRFGNTQHAGCSWVLYKIPLAARHSEEPLEFAVHAYLPAGVEARAEAWTVEQWWHEDTRPEADGFYGDSPS